VTATRHRETLQVIQATKTTPSFLDALAALRRVLWSQRITTMSRSEPDHTKITEALHDTLTYAA